MDVENESSVLECVEDNNGFIGEVETIGDKLASASTTVVEADKYKQTNLQAETSPPMSKGFGLRKWRRRVRRDVVNTSANMENSRILKRELSVKANPLAKQMHFPGPDVNQDSLGSDGSVNNMVGVAIGGESHGIGLAFAAGVNSDNSEDRSSKSSTAASGPNARYVRRMGHSWDKQRAKYLDGKSVISSGYSGQQKKSSVGKSKKLRGERIKIEKEYSHSSMESSDSGSSNVVFMQGASSHLSGREQGERRMMDYNEENSDHEAHTSNQLDKDEEEAEDYSQGESVEESQIKNNGCSSHNLDSLSEAINTFHTLQEVLDKELQKFQGLGKEPISSLHDGGESSSCIHAGAAEVSSSRRGGSENMGELKLTSLESEILNLVNNVEHLKLKLEETKIILEAKETQICELKSTISISELHNRGTEISMEDIFQQKMEAEIEYIVFSDSVANLNSRIKLIEKEKTLCENQAHKTLSKLELVETKAENLKNQAQDLQSHCAEITEIQEVKSFKKRVYKTTSCLILQLGLVFMLLNFQLMPESENVVPT